MEASVFVEAMVCILNQRQLLDRSLPISQKTTLKMTSSIKKEKMVISCGQGVGKMVQTSLTEPDGLRRTLCARGLKMHKLLFQVFTFT